MAKTNDLAVFIITRTASCNECGEDLGRRAWITLTEDKTGTGERECGAGSGAVARGVA